MGGEEHRDPGTVLRPGPFGEDRYGELLSRPYMDCRHPRSGIITGIVPGKGVDNIGTERHFQSRPPASFGNRLVEILSQRDGGRQRQVHHRDTGILAEGNTELFSKLHILQDIGKLTLSNRACLAGSCSLDDAQYIGGKTDCSLAICMECGIGKCGMGADRVLHLHSTILWSGE